MANRSSRQGSKSSRAWSMRCYVGPEQYPSKLVDVCLERKRIPACRLLDAKRAPSTDTIVWARRLDFRSQETRVARSLLFFNGKEVKMVIIACYRCFNLGFSIRASCSGPEPTSHGTGEPRKTFRSFWPRFRNLDSLPRSFDRALHTDITHHAPH